MVLKPLTKLLQDSVKWNWNEPCVKAFQEAKELLTVSPVLVHYDPSVPMRMAADASSHGVGAVISHVFLNGEEKPIAYAPRTLLPTECNYAQSPWNCDWNSEIPPLFVRGEIYPQDPLLRLCISYNSNL